MVFEMSVVTVFFAMLASRLRGGKRGQASTVQRCSGLPDRIKHDAARQQFRQNVGCPSPRPGDDHVGRNATTPNTAQFAGDLRIVASPVGAEEYVVSMKKFLLNTAILQNRIFINWHERHHAAVK